MTNAEALNQTVFCKLAPSPIHGVGVFAIRDILRGIELSRVDYEVFVCEEEDFNNILPEIQELILERNTFAKDRPLIFTNPNRNQTYQSFMNHSNNPNSDGRFSLRDIMKGEEITEDFNLVCPYPLHKLSVDKNKKFI